MITNATPSTKTYPIQPDGDQIVEPHFSGYPCENNGSDYCHLAGDRYDVEYYDKLDGKLKCMTVCSDCYVKVCV